MAEMPEPSLATELQRHAAAMRQLARDLVGRDSADDLVQDTAVRALRSPPAVRQGLFGWLATVMRNLAANRRRDDARRLRRERASDTGVVEACSAADLAMRRDTARVVTESLWALPEPYQRTLVLRYFQGLAPTQIAAATGVPLATVKSRLQRGLEQLRADVARRDGRDWRMALAPAFGLGVPAGYWLPFSVASMGAFGKTAACVVVGSLGCLSWWIGRSEPDVDVPIEVVTLLEPSGAPANSALPAAGERDPVGRVEATSARSEPDLAHAFALELQCTVVDPEGAPVVGAQVAVAPPGAVLATWPVATNADGKVTVSFGARVPAMVCAVGLVHSGQKALQQVRLESGKAAHVAFVVGVAPMPFAVRVDANGEQIAEVPSCVDSATDCRQCHQPSIGPDTFVVHGQVAPGWHPAAVFRAADAIAIRSDFATQAMRSANALALTWRLTEQPQSIGSVLTGRVFGADGRPVRAVRVLAQRLPARDWSATVRTKADGSFELDGVADGRIELRVGGGAEGAMRHEVTIQAGKRDHVDCLLQTGRTLRGRAFGPDGVLAGARVEYEVDGAVGDVAEVAPDGSFAFANLAPGPGRLLLWGQSTRLLPLAIEPNVLPDSGDIVFDLKLRPATDGSVRAEVRCGIELAGEAAELRVWQRESGRGTFAARAKEGHFHLAGLAAGFYRFEVLDAHGGHSDLGEHWLDGVGCVDLGTVVLPAPAIVEIPADAARGAVELYRRLDSVDVGAGGQFVGCQGLRLPQGSWLGVWRVGNAVHSREFTLQSGTSVALDFGN